MPCRGAIDAGGNVTPNSRSALVPPGRIPSPHALSTGGSAGSTRVTVSPSRAQVIEVERPAGPPPITRTSQVRRMAVYCVRSRAHLLGFDERSSCILISIQNVPAPSQANPAHPVRASKNGRRRTTPIRDRRVLSCLRYCRRCGCCVRTSRSAGRRPVANLCH